MRADVSRRFTLYKRRTAGKAPDLRQVMVASLTGVRGAITLAGVMSLPLLMPDGLPFPARARNRLARDARISDETSRKLVREIDLVDSRYR